MRCLLILSVLAAAAGAQETPDERIRSEYQTMMNLAAPPKEGQRLEEEQAKARAEEFKAAIDAFLERWRPRAAELNAGRYVLGKTLAMAGKQEEAIPLLRAFTEGNPSSEDVEDGLMLLGSAYLDTKDFAAAAQVFSTFLAERPKSDLRLNAEFYLGVTRYQQGNNDEALQRFKTVIDTGGDTPLVADAHLLTIQALRDMGRIDDARARLSALLEKNADAPSLLALKEQIDWIGKDAPEIGAIEVWLQGDPVTLRSLRGRVVVVNFFADKYEACQAELKALSELAPKFADQPVTFVGLTKYYRPKDKVSAEQEQALLRAFLRESGVPFAVALARDVSNLHAYGVRGIPYTVVVTKEGKVAYVKPGGGRRSGRAIEDLANAIRRSLGGQ